MQKIELKIINRDIVKYIAIIPMILGHTISSFVEHDILASNTFLTVIQALAIFAPPIFFFSIVDGYNYTRSKKKYALRLLVFAIITQISFALESFGTIFTIEAIQNLNVFFTLLAGLISIIIWESKFPLVVRITVIVLIDVLTVLLGSEWMIFGVLIILGLHIFSEKPKIRFIWFVVCICISQYICWGMSFYTLISPGFITGTLAGITSYLFRTNFYNGKKGKNPTFAKWFFYLIYPIHYLLIYIAILMIKSSNLS